MAQEAPSLMAELVEEILLRFPPDDPASLLRAALVSKSWCRLVCGPGFNRRFREFHHRTSPPLLGFFCGAYKPCGTYSASGDSRFLPLTSSFCRLPRAPMPNWHAVDARHGRILFYDEGIVVTPESVRLQLIVWNPIITGEASTLPLVPMYAHMYRWSAALVCDHVDSGHGPFRVVVVATAQGFTTSACVYSSERHVWSTPISTRDPGAYLLRARSALIGNALYFKCRWSKILEYDMSKKELSLISIPSKCMLKCIALMTAEDGGLGVAVVRMSKLYTWSREVGLDGAGRWVQQRVLELDKLLPVSRLASRVVAAENALSVIFVRTGNGLFVIDLKFGRVRKIYERPDDRDILDIVPYACFCTPVVGSGLCR